MRSPFFIVQDFISPKVCELIIEYIRVNAPNVDQEGKPIKLERHSDVGENIIYGKLKEYIPDIEERYNCKYRGTQEVVFQHFPERAELPAEPPHCINSQYIRKKWVKLFDIDLVGYLFLKDFNNNPPFDPMTDAYGGKIEFPAYDFSITPQRGTLIIFPAGPHFIHAVSPMLVNETYQAKINICISPKEGGLWLYNPKDFPTGAGRGFIDGWLNEYL